MLPFNSRKKDIIIKRDSDTSPKYGCRPSERGAKELLTYGIVNIDKPKGPTSHQVSAYVQQMLNISKSGHSGTLDPKVTGVLPVALGRATRVVEVLLSAGKEYVALMHIHKPLPEEKIRQVCNEFIGKITQLPPIKSAVKRQNRERSIYYIDILEIDGQDVLFRVGTQAGTYIRKLIHDIGLKLGTGAHMAELRRTRAGPFLENTLVTLQDLADAYHYYKGGNDKYLLKIIQPVETAVEHLPKVWILDTTVDTVCHGASVKVPGISKIQTGIIPGETVSIMTLKDELVGLGKAIMDSQSIQRQDRGIAVKTDKVFMLCGIYPRIDRMMA